jgi:glycosyltransferase involved in cell wall biosynthesis
MEAMWAGRVPVVTRTTGSRSLVADISDGLIVEPQPDALAEGIISHFEAPLAQRRERAVQAKRLVKPLTEDRQQDAFVTAVNRVL